MNIVSRFVKKLSLLFTRKRFHGELDEEMTFHRSQVERDFVANGMAAEDARYAATRQFGNATLLKEKSHEVVGFRTETVVQDMRFAFRTLARDTGFTTVSILILALAIGANIAVFSVVNTLLLRPLPFPNSHELVWIAPPPAKCGLSCATYSSDAFDEFRAQSRVYQDVTGYFAFSSPDNLRLTGHGDPQPATGIDVINNFFQVLEVQPMMGRLFTPADTRNGAEPVILLTHAWWERQFARDPNIIGKTIDLNGTQTTIIGVLPATFDFGAVFSPGSKVDAFTPLNLDVARNWGNIVTFMGRMKPGVTVAQAADDARRIAPSMYFNVKFPQTLGQYVNSLVPVPLKDYVSGHLRRSLVVLWCAVGMILLIACVNLSNLLLARTATRSKEFALRGALGASRRRIIQQLLTESLILSGAGALLGLVLASVVVTWLAHQGAIALPLFSTLHIDAAALGWTVLIAVAASVLFGLVPALRMTGGSLFESLKDSSAGAGQSGKHERIRSILVVSEVALACVLLVSAGLLMQSFLKVLDVDLGFEPDRAASIKVDYDDSAPTNEASIAKRTEIFQRILARVSALPGVESAGISDYLPLGPNREWDTPMPKGTTYNIGDLPGPLVYVVTPGFIHAMGMHLQGRDFSWDDGPNTPEVVVINASAARFYWPGGNAVDHILVSGKDELLVIGVVDDVHEESVEGQPGWQIYYTSRQKSPTGAQLVVRSKLQPSELAGSIMHTLRDLNPNQPAAEFRPIRTIVDHAVSPRRFFMLLVTAFAVLGLVLAAIGIYGVISYSVTQKTQAIGIRMALGASAGRVQRDVLINTLRLTLFGILAGSVASLLSARLIASLLFDTSPWDPITFGATMLALLIVALLSGFLPARRASHINPIIALRIQ